MAVVMIEWLCVAVAVVGVGQWSCSWVDVVEWM